MTKVLILMILAEVEEQIWTYSFFGMGNSSPGV